MDITTKDHDGRPWNSSSSMMRRLAIQAIKRDQHLLIVGSPMCNDWSTFMSLNWNTVPTEDTNKRMT